MVQCSDLGSPTSEAQAGHQPGAPRACHWPGFKTGAIQLPHNVIQPPFPLTMYFIWFNLLYHLISLSSTLEFKDVLTFFQTLYLFWLFKFLCYVQFIYLFIYLFI